MLFGDVFKSVRDIDNILGSRISRRGFRGSHRGGFRGGLSMLVRDSSAVRLAIAVGRPRTLHTENSGFASWSAHVHVSWLSDFIFYQKPLYKSLHQSFFLFIHNHLTLRKWCYTPLQHDFALDPIIPPFDFHFRIYKRGLAILTE